MKSKVGRLLVICFFFVALVGAVGSSLAEDFDSGLSQGDGGKWIEEKTGQFLPLDLQFQNDRGETIALGDFIDKPTILLPIYFYCPNICSSNLANLAVALNNLSFAPGEEYRVIALSFNEVETHETAAHAKKNYIKLVDDGFPPDEWVFLTGDKDEIVKVTEAVGFRFQKVDDETFIHPAALVVIDGSGQIIRYVYGSFLAGDIDMALSDAINGTPSLSVKRLLGFCFNYDPDKNKSLFQWVKLGVLIILGTLVIFVLFFFKKSRN